MSSSTTPTTAAAAGAIAVQPAAHQWPPSTEYLAALDNQLTDWSARNTTKLQLLCNRIIAAETWQADKSVLHGSTGIDLCMYVNTVVETYLDYVEPFAQHLTATHLAQLSATVDISVSLYIRDLLNTCGNTTGLVPDTNIKLRQSPEPQTKPLNTFAKFTLRAKQLNHRDTTPSPERRIRHSQQSTFSTCQTLQQLCCKLSTIGFIYTQLVDLNVSVMKQINDMRVIHNRISQRAQRANECVEPLQYTLFQPSCDRLLSAETKLFEYVGMYAAYVQLGPTYMSKMYAPTPTDQNRFANSVLSQQLDSTMQLIYNNVPADKFRDCIYYVFMNAVSLYVIVLLYCRRSIDVYAIMNIVQPDATMLMNVFQREVALQNNDKAILLRNLVSLMQNSTSELIQLYRSGKLEDGITPLLVARVIALRPGDKVQQFIKSIRSHFPQLPQRSGESVG